MNQSFVPLLCLFGGLQQLLFIVSKHIPFKKQEEKEEEFAILVLLLVKDIGVTWLRNRGKISSIVGMNFLKT